MSSLRLRLFTSVALLSLLLSSSALAQDRLFHDGWELGAIGAFGQRLGPAGGLDGSLVAGGRIRVSDTDAVDLRTGARRALPAGAIVVAVDEARPRVLLGMPGTAAPGTFDLAMFELVAGATETLVTDVCAVPVFGTAPALVAYAYDGQLAVTQRCDGTGALRNVVAVDLSVSPRQLRVLPAPISLGSGAALSSDGERLFVRTVEGFLTYRTDGFDVATGAALGTVAAGGDMRWDDALDALVVTVRRDGATSEVLVVNRTMGLVAAVPFASRICPARVQVSTHTGRIYVTTDGGSNTLAQPLRLEAFAGVPLHSVGVAFPAPQFSTCAGVVLRTAPGAPRNLQATVTGRDVSLDWDNAGGASGHLLEIGLGPGRTDLTIFLGADSRAGFSQVPPGVYYLRVRGGNQFGGGRPSSELRLAVP